MSAIAAYRELLRIVGPAYIFVAFLGRIPLAMSQLGTLVLVSTMTGSYTTGGAAAGAMALSNALAAPIGGSLSDRIGQRPVILVQSWWGAIGLVAIVWATQNDASPIAIVAISALAGVAIPQVGPLARVRWANVSRGREDSKKLIDAAFSYEGAADEASFVFGPALVGLLAFLVNPSGAMLAAAGLLAFFGTVFAIHPTGKFTKGDSKLDPGPFLTKILAVLALAQVSIGMVFGASQTGTTVLAIEGGDPGVAGLVHATMGVGSVVAGLAVASLPERITYARRAQVSAITLFVLSLPLLFSHTIPTVVITIFLMGFAVAPFMISNFALAGRVVREDRVGTAMTLLAGATVFGYAIGSGTAGRLADIGGHTPAYAVAVVAAVISVMCTQFTSRIMDKART